MRQLFTVLFLLAALCSLTEAQTGKLETKQMWNSADSVQTITLSLAKFNTRLHELQSLLEREIQTHDQARAVLQQSEDNIKSLQAAIQALAMVKSDTTLHARKISK